MSMVKLIKISDEIHAELNQIGMRGESFNDIVTRLLKSYKEKHSKK